MKKLIDQLRTKIKVGSVIDFSRVGIPSIKVHATVIDIEENTEDSKVLLEFKFNSLNTLNHYEEKTLHLLLMVISNNEALVPLIENGEIIYRIKTNAYKVATLGTYLNGDHILLSTL